MLLVKESAFGLKEHFIEEMKFMYQTVSGNLGTVGCGTELPQIILG